MTNLIAGHIKAAVKKRAIPIHFSSGKDAHGRSCWYVFICPYAELRKMQAAKASVKPEEYGYVVASGFGTTPPQNLCEQISDEYGFVIKTMD